MTISILQKTLCVALLIAACGCGSETAADSASGPSDEEHLEHHVPEHKPHDFSAAVDSIQTRVQQLETSNDPTDEQLSELRDILNWLPEIAADSDMRRPHWEQVDTIAGELAELFQQYASQSKTDRAELATQLTATAEKLVPLKGTERGDAK